jgi:2-aminoadipate transaminase
MGIDYEAMVAKQAAHALPGRVVRNITGPGKIYEFGGGVPDPDAFPTEGLQQAAVEALSQGGRDLVLYPGPLGYDGLREVVARRLKIYEALEVSPDNIMITSGSMQAIQLLSEVLLDPGDTVVVEGLSYMGALRVFRRWNARLVGVPTDDQGICTDKLEETLAELNAKGIKPKLLYLIPSFQNPTGVTYSLERRQEAVRIAKRYGVLILEDDSYVELRFEGEWLPSMYSLDTEGLVVRVGTFSKIVGAGVRQAWALAPTPLLHRMQGVKIDGGTNALASRIIAAYLGPNLEERISRVQQVLKTKRDAMLQALADYLGDSAEWTHPEGGMFIWVKLPPGTDPDKLWETAAAERIIYVPGWNFTPDGQGARNYIRLCFGYPPPEDIREGVKHLAQAIEAAGGILAKPTPTPG